MADSQCVAIVIPVYNRAHLIGRCLDSVYAQTYRPLQVIVVDNNSTDLTVEAVNDWVSAHRLQNDSSFQLMLMQEKKRGAAAARNSGLRAVTAEWTLFFDSDDVMLPDLVVTAMSASSNADLVNWKARRIRMSGESEKHHFHKKNLMSRHVYNSILATQTYMAKTALFRKVRGWEEQALVWNDWELGIRILAASPRINWVDRQLVDVHEQKESITGESFSEKQGMWEKTISIVERKVSRDPLFKEIGLKEKRKLLGQLDYRRAVLAAHYSQEGRKDLASRLMSKTLRKTSLSDWRKRILKLVFRFTSKGGRGAYYLWGL